MKRILSLALVLVLVLTACSGGNTDGTFVRQTLEPEGIDTAKMSYSQSFDLAANLYTGIYGVDGKGDLILTGADSVTKSADGLTYTVKLKQGQKWVDNTGKEVGDVTSADYISHYERVLNPNTKAPMFYLLTGVISGANDYYKGATTDFSKVGVKATDDYTLEFKLSHVAPYFEGMLAFPTYYPNSKAGLEKFGDKFGTTAENTYYNGPFYSTIADVTYEVKMTRNEKWYDAKNVQLEGVTFRTIVDENAKITAFASGDIDYFNTGISETYEQGVTGSDVKPVDRLTAYSFYMSLNQDESRVTSDKDLREALYYGFDRENINTSASGKINKTIEYYMPEGITPTTYEGKEYRASAKDSFGSFDQDRAKKALDTYMKKKGFTDPSQVEVSFLINDSPTGKATATAVQESLKQVLGITVKTDIQPDSTYRTSRSEGAFDMASGGWGPDYGDPSTFFDVFKSENIGSINAARYKSDAYDKAAKEASQISDVDARFKAYAALEEQLLEENYTIIPYYQKNDPYFVNPKYEIPQHLYLKISDAYVKINK